MKDKVTKIENYEMRLIKISDVDDYYKYGFETPDAQSSYYTGTTKNYSKKQIRSYVEKIIADTSRFDFIIFCEDEIIGEVVLNNINDNRGHYRICIFSKNNFSKGIGYKATVKILEFGFKEIGLESVDLEVFPFNKRGVGLYKKLGFVIEEIIVDEEAEEPYKEIIIMRLKKINFLNTF